MSYLFYEHSCQASEILFPQLIVKNTNINTTPKNSNTVYNKYLL